MGCVKVLGRVVGSGCPGLARVAWGCDGLACAPLLGRKRDVIFGLDICLGFSCRLEELCDCDAIASAKIVDILGRSSFGK